MSERDASRVQLDFPQLTADIIRQLRLTGTLGLIDFLDAVRPVYIVASREGALAFTASAPLFTSAGIADGFVQSAVVNTILADTGPLAAGDYDIFANMALDGTIGGAGRLELQHRNAANSADLARLLIIPSAGTTSASQAALPLVGYTVALNERLRVQVVGGAVAGTVSCSIGTQIRPTP